MNWQVYWTILLQILIASIVLFGPVALYAGLISAASARKQVSKKENGTDA